MQITGTLVEIGQLEDESGADGIVLRLDDDRLVTIKGVAAEELRPVAMLFMERVTITAAAAA